MKICRVLVITIAGWTLGCRRRSQGLRMAELQKCQEHEANDWEGVQSHGIHFQLGIGEEKMGDELRIFWSNWEEFKDFLF